MAIFLAILTNVALFTWLASHHPVHGQPALGATLQQLDRQQTCTILDIGDVAFRESDNVPSDDISPFQVDTMEEDPKLAKMPGFDFKAYRRADIDNMYREAPGSRIEKKPLFKGQAGKFVNMSPERLDLYWENIDGPMGHFISHAGGFESTGTSTFPDHVFHFVLPKTEEIVCTFRMQKGTAVYYCDPFVPYDASDPSAGKYSGPIRSKSDLDQRHLELYENAQLNREFAPIYKNFTGGSEWLGNYPTEPPKHHIWRADYFGQEHFVQTRETQFVELPPKEVLHRMTSQQLRRNTTDPPAMMQYRLPGVMNITIKTVSVEPRIFQIDGFLSEVEVDQ